MTGLLTLVVCKSFFRSVGVFFHGVDSWPYLVPEQNLAKCELRDVIHNRPWVGEGLNDQSLSTLIFFVDLRYFNNNGSFVV